MNKTLFSDLIQCQARKYGDRVALRHRDYKTNTWIPTTWNQFAATVTNVSNSLLGLGVDVQENIGVFTQNKPESLFMDFGAFGIRAVTVPLYATSSEAQVHYILEDAQIRYLFVGEQQQYDVAFRVMAISSSLKQIVVFDRDVKLDPQDQTTMYMDDFLALGKDGKYQQEVDKKIHLLYQKSYYRYLYHNIPIWKSLQIYIAFHYL